MEFRLKTQKGSLRCRFEIAFCQMPILQFPEEEGGRGDGGEGGGEAQDGEAEAEAGV